jgi:multimeric flavodoxin WrbA
MKVVSVNGSPRQNGNTALMLRWVCDRLAEAGGFKADKIYLEGMNLQPCGACGVCAKVKDGKCHGRNDDGNELIARSRAADIILLGSPVYFGSLTAQIKIYMDRVGFVSRTGDMFLNRKIGAAVVPGRRAGHLLTFAELNMWFHINGMVIPGSSYWNIGHALREGEILNDAEALATLDELAENLLWLAEKIRA